jgi:hypothetical protein
MRRSRIFCAASALGLAAFAATSGFSQVAPATKMSQHADLGKAAPAPPNLELNPPPGKIQAPLGPVVTGGFSVNTDSREEVRSFYNAIFPTSDNVAQNSTADVTSCTPGHNSLEFQQAELRRINWFRAMAGMPAAIYLDPVDNWGSQQMAVIISANNALNHNPPTNYSCYNTFAASYAGGDQALGADGAEAIKDFIWDYGANNNEVGHRRWIFYPPEIVMGVGDVPGNGPNAAGNLTYVFDPVSFGARPATRQPYVAWPPKGFVPYQVVFPYWSFALTNADFTNATVTMTSNGVPVTTTIQPYQVGFGENTLVWVPMGLDATSGGTTFPFGGADTVYSVTVSNIIYNGTKVLYWYSVTAFDPAAPGADYIPATVLGATQIVAGVASTFSATAPNNSHVTSYDFLTAQLVSGDLTDNANSGLVNFTPSPAPIVPEITNSPTGNGTCFHLCHADPTSQFLQLNENLFPASNTVVSFDSLLGYATTDESAHVQVSTDGGANWQDLFVEIGSNGSGESSFTTHSLSLSNYAGTPTLLRFNYAFTGGSYYPESDNFVGWCIENFIVTNTQALINQATNNSAVTNFVSGNLTDSANNGLTNFTVTPPPYYYVVTNPPVGSEPHCFHLTHLDPASQLMQLNEVLLPAGNSTLNFSSQMGYATSDETARVQVSTNSGATWDDLFVQAGTGSPEASFTPHTISLGAYAGLLTTLRFNFAFTGGGFYPQSDNYIGWNIEDIALTNIQQQLVTIVNTTNFNFTPARTGTYLLQAQPVIFNQFPLAFGPVKKVTVVSNTTTTIVMSQPVLTNKQVLLNFTVSGAAASTFHLLQTTQLPARWTTNTAASFITNIPGASYRYTATNNVPAQFFRVQTP